MSDASAPSRVTHADGDSETLESYDLTAELVFSHNEFVLSPTLSACPELRLQLEGHTRSEGETDLYVSIFGSRFDSLHSALLADPTVADARPVASFVEEAVYCVTPSAEAVRLLPHVAAVDGFVRDVGADAEGWALRLHLPSRAALSTLNDRCTEADIAVSVTRLCMLERSECAAPLPLTGDQRTLLTTAREEGYFETPRGISQRELAERFGVSPSAISQRLRTAVGALVTSTLTA